MSSPCSPNGACASSINGYTCTCNTGYGGINCQEKINFCSPNPCVNGNCTQLVGGYACQCPAGYAGTRCEIYQKQCINNPCQTAS